jgi:hypothetical protein
VELQILVIIELYVVDGHGLGLLVADVVLLEILGEALHDDLL